MAESVINHSAGCDVAALGGYVEFLASFQPAGPGEVVLPWPVSRQVAYSDHRPSDCMCGRLQEQRIRTELVTLDKRLRWARSMSPVNELVVARLHQTIMEMAAALRDTRAEVARLRVS